MHTLDLHPDVTPDISRIMDYYEATAGKQLAEEFYNDLQVAFHKAAQSPEIYHAREHGFRRVQLERFPYHFLFRIIDSQSIRILVVRHHRRKPLLGLDRV